jgi:hypothetical protein
MNSGTLAYSCFRMYLLACFPPGTSSQGYPNFPTLVAKCLQAQAKALTLGRGASAALFPSPTTTIPFWRQCMPTLSSKTMEQARNTSLYRSHQTRTAAGGDAPDNLLPISTTSMSVFDSDPMLAQEGGSVPAHGHSCWPLADLDIDPKLTC